MADYKSRRFDRDRKVDMSHRSDYQKYLRENNLDDPPNSRLFIVCGRSITEEQFKEAFSKFGSIEEIWMVKDRESGDPKGVTYIKFSKTSEAALAMEEMNGRIIGGHPRPLKVLIAHSRDQGSKRETNEDERLVRLFVVVPKTMTESELREHFVQYGDIDYISIVKDRNTKENKGYGYVKYHRMSHAAKAFEECDRSFKAIFAEPKPQRYTGPPPFGGGGPMGPPMGPPDMPMGGPRRGGDRDGFSGGIPSSASSGAYDMMGFNDGIGGRCNPEGFTKLTVMASPSLNQDQLWRLFDIVPGLDYCDLFRRKVGQARGVATVVYNNPQSANYAREKLHGFEYPPGERIIVKFDGSYNPEMNNSRAPPPGGPVGFMGPHATGGGGGGPGSPYTSPNQPQAPPSHRPDLQNDLATLAETIAQATSLIQAAGLGQRGNGSSNMPPMRGETYDPSYCSVELPPHRPLAPIDSQVAERLFIVCHPTPPPSYALKDAFGRFGNLIDIYMLSGKCCGYAKYAKEDCAKRAMMALHGQELCGMRLKVMQAEPHEKPDSSRKRFRADNEKVEQMQ